MNVQDPKIKEAALHVVDLKDVVLEKCINTNFVTDFKMNVVNLDVREVKSVNDEVFKRVVTRLETAWGRPLTDDEKEIIKATTNTEDATEILPTPFEKFMIRFGREAAAKSVESTSPLMHFDDTSRAKILLKSKVYTTLWKTMEHCGLVDAHDTQEFEKFLSAWN